ncbi:MAG: efflux RND transporter periplasmic adaptor subunit [Deltaproteobacteria bacterium]|nr:efflux RND transporter periplasmic adaptor subunit [Deltaproteobacteria bacterium]
MSSPLRSPYALLGTSLGLLLPTLAACSSPTAEAQIPKEERFVSVEQAEVTKDQVPRFLTLTGTLIANQDSELASDAAGKVKEVYVERGSFVKAGAPIARLDARQAELNASAAKAQLEIAKAERDLAQKDCERAAMLFKEKAISSADYDRSKAACTMRDWGIEAANTQLQMAEKALSDSVVRAPFAGIVAERYLSPGEFVGPGAKVVALVQVDPIRLELSVPEAATPAIKEGLEVEFDVSGYPGRTFKGVVKYVSPSVRRATRDQLVEALVNNKDQVLRPGMFATARLSLASAELPLIPRSALKRDGTTQRVFVIREGHLEERVVQVGGSRGDLVAIEAGVKPGERVAKVATAELKDGLAVR